MLNVIVGIVGTALVGAITGLIKLYSKVNVQEEARTSLVTLINEKFEHLGEKVDIQFDSMDNRLSRIERSMNGHLLRE